MKHLLIRSRFRYKSQNVLIQNEIKCSVYYYNCSFSFLVFKSNKVPGTRRRTSAAASTCGWSSSASRCLLTSDCVSIPSAFSTARPLLLFVLYHKKTKKAMMINNTAPNDIPIGIAIFIMLPVLGFISGFIDVTSRKLKQKV